jgi:hypothetical protein
VGTKILCAASKARYQLTDHYCPPDRQSARICAPKTAELVCSTGIIASLKMGVIAWSSPRFSDARATDPICHQPPERAPSSRRRPLNARTGLEYAGLCARGFRSSRRLVTGVYVGNANRPISPGRFTSFCMIKRSDGTIVPFIEQMRHSDATNGANDSASCR